MCSICSMQVVVLPSPVMKPPSLHLPCMQCAVPIRNAKQIAGMRAACRLAREILDKAHAAVKPGITTDDIDQIVSPHISSGSSTISCKIASGPISMHIMAQLTSRVTKTLCMTLLSADHCIISGGSNHVMPQNTAVYRHKDA